MPHIGTGVLSQALLLWVGVAVANGLTGCALFQPSSALPPTPTVTLSAQEIATRSAQKMTEVKTLHFRIEFTGATEYADPMHTLALKEVEGDLARPGNLRSLIKMRALGMATEVGLIRYGSEVYVTNPLNQRWGKLAPEDGAVFDPTLVFDVKAGVPAVLPTLELRKIGVEPFRERAHYHLQASAQGDYLNTWSVGLIPAGPVTLDVWIDCETFLLHRLIMTETTSDPKDPTVWHIELSGFDEPVDIKPPPVAQ